MIKHYDVYLPIKALPTQYNRHQKIFVTHNNFPGIGRSIDIGVDCHNFFPLYIETAIEMAKSKQTETTRAAKR